MPCKKQRDYPNRHEVYRAEYGNIDFSYGKGGDEAAALIEKLLSALEDKDEEIDWKVMRIYKDTVGKLIDVESPDGVIDVLPEKWCELWDEKEHWKNMFDEMTKKKDILQSQMDKKLALMDEEIYRLHDGWTTCIEQSDKKDKETHKFLSGTEHWKNLRKEYIRPGFDRDGTTPILLIPVTLYDASIQEIDWLRSNLEIAIEKESVSWNKFPDGPSVPGGKFMLVIPRNGLHIAKFETGHGWADINGRNIQVDYWMELPKKVDE